MRSREHRIELAEAEGTVKRVHVDQRLVRKGEPAVTIQTSAGSLKASEVEIDGPSRVVHRPDDPLSCGARVWIETRSPVRIVPSVEESQERVRYM